MKQKRSRRRVVSIIFFGVGRERRVRKKQRGVAMRKRSEAGAGPADGAIWRMTFQVSVR